MSHDDIRAALESRTDLPWRPSHDGPVATRPSDTYDVLDNDGETVAASLFYLDAHLIANASTWLAELLAEVDNARRELGDVHVSLYSEIAMLTARADAAEQTNQRVRGLAEAWATQPNDYDEDTEQQIEDGRAILRALDGGAS